MCRGLTLAVLSLGLLLPATAGAQTRERVKITNVRLGLPKGPFGGDTGRPTVFKPGQWAPVYVDLECVRDLDEDIQLVVETRDADEAITEGVVDLGGVLKVKGDKLASNELGRLPYLKPGNSYATVTVRVKGAKTGRTYSEAVERTFGSVEGPTYVICGIGYNLGGLRLATSSNRDDRDDNPNQNESGREFRGGWVETAQIIDVGMLPDQWIGYAGVDLMVIGTAADRGFWEALAAPAHERKRKAIAEWVRRGGRVVVSLGTNPDLLEAHKELREMLPATVPAGGKRTVSVLSYEWALRGADIRDPADQITFRDGKSQFSVVKLQPRADRPSKALVTEPERARQAPLVVQGPYGQGRVTVVGLDLDRAPFSEWNQRRDFWENLVNHAGYKLPLPSDKLDKYGNRIDEFSTSLQGSLDFFEGVPVVSFGWVALFILIYIVLIGPVDYLFLKKVVKRLEWTWVTFPVIVITVSAGAYFAAYALKGRDLKMNKVDVVDIDLAGGRVDGSTWFTLFSPRIQNYTIGVEPAGPGWTPADPSLAAHDTVLSWQSTVERNRYSSGGTGGLFSKRYRYQSMPDPADPNRDLYASGLESVPIQVWTTKAFSAQWTAVIDPNMPPVSAELSVSNGDPKGLVGTITNHLPVEKFSDIALFWRDHAYDLGTELPNGFAKSISTSAETGRAPTGVESSVHDWLIDEKKRYMGAAEIIPKVQNQSGSSFETGTTRQPNFRLWKLLFTDTAAENLRTQGPNASLRRLDQSWRVGEDRPEQAILVLRIPTREASAEEMTQSPESPSRLWLGELPTSGGSRPALQGTLKQETYVRVFIPVKQMSPAKK
jgi:hypothetical protein